MMTFDYRSNFFIFYRCTLLPSGLSLLPISLRSAVIPLFSRGIQLCRFQPDIILPYLDWRIIFTYKAELSFQMPVLQYCKYFVYFHCLGNCTYSCKRIFQARFVEHSKHLLSTVCDKNEISSKDDQDQGRNCKINNFCTIFKANYPYKDL